MFLEVSLVRHGFITAEQFVEAVEWQLEQRPRLGRLALESGRLTMKQVFAVLQAQAEGGKPFGETAIELGFLTKRQVANLLRLQTQRTPLLPQCLVEIGAIDPEALEEASFRLRHEQTGYLRHKVEQAPTTRRSGRALASAAEEAEFASC
ncbi:MAG: hypothetical protein GXY58_09920 [Planctomycetaceae bacterium]|mgnify:FL=1|nr:hypothetical protein [Planctomycetaceae bacterium]